MQKATLRKGRPLGEGEGHGICTVVGSPNSAPRLAALRALPMLRQRCQKSAASAATKVIKCSGRSPA